MRRVKWILVSLFLLFFTGINAQLPLASGAPDQRLLNEAVDISEDFRNFTNTYFIADNLVEFDPATGQGKVRWTRHVYKTNQAFDNMLATLTPSGGNEFPSNEYEANPVMPFSLEFVSPGTVRIRMKTGFEAQPEEPSLMLGNGFAPKDNSWKYTEIQGGHQYTGKYGFVIIRTRPWHIEFYDVNGNLLTKTFHKNDNSVTYTPVLPFIFVRSSADYSRSVNTAFSLSPGEKIFGLG